MARTEVIDSLAVRAVWLHYAGGLTQAEIASRLGITKVKAHRLISRALAAGVLKVTIDAKIVECVDLENRIAKYYGLDFCEIAPDLGEAGLPLRALGIAGASYLRREIEGGQHSMIGLAYGRTLAAAVRQLPRLNAHDIRFVSLLGGLARNYSANPYEVIYRLAECTGAQAYMLPVPFFANSISDREVLLQQRGVQEVFDMARKATLKVVGIGTVNAKAQLVLSGMIGLDDVEAIAAEGGVAELLGHFFDSVGRMITTSFTARVLAAPFGDGQQMVAIAGGNEKLAAIVAILRSGCLNGLITDEKTARRMIDVS